MNRIYLSLSIALFGVLTSGCITDYDCCNPKVISIDVSTLSIGETLGATQDFTLFCTTGWEITNLPPWLTASPESSTTGGTVTVTLEVIQANPTTSPRPVTLTFTAANGDKVMVVVTQEPFVFITDIDIADETLFYGDGPIQITSGTTPPHASVTDLTWESSDITVVEVDADGVITVISVGTATITATATDGSGQTGTCTVTVEPKPITISGFDISKIYDGNTTVIGGWGTLSFDGLASGETADVNTTGVTVVYANADPGTNKTMTVTGAFTMTGGTAIPSNYSITQPTPQGTIIAFAGLGTSAANAFEIENPAQLALLALMVNGGDNQSNVYYKLVDNIDAGSQWIPIGDYSSFSSATCFAGTFDGQGHTVTINGIGTISPDGWGSSYYVGLFGKLTLDAVIQNLRVDGSFSFDAGALGCIMGGIAGSSGSSTAENSTIKNCVGAAHIELLGNPSMYGLTVGGIVGSNSTNSKIQNCYSIANVTANHSGTGENCYAGGIAGANSGTITNCYATGSISATMAGSRHAFAGGIVANEYGTTANCVALHTAIVAYTPFGINYMGRIVSRLAPPAPPWVAGGVLTNNRAIAISGMSATGALDTDIDGLLITTLEAETQSTYQTAAGWPFGTNDAAPWVWNGTRPILYWEL